MIRDLDLLLPDGDHLAVVGPSGVGKSTLAGIIAGLLDPQSGQRVLIPRKPTSSPEQCRRT